jgi:hypothetical protein
MKVALKDIVDALEMQFDEYLNYLDRQTGKIEMVSRDELNMAEEGEADDELPQSEEHEFDVAEAIVTDPDRFEKLPTKFDIHEWEIMREFAECVEPERLSDELQNAIHGAGAFRYFKDTLRRYRREKDWYAYRAEALREIAIEWCQENSIEYTES